MSEDVMESPQVSLKTLHAEFAVSSRVGGGGVGVAFAVSSEFDTTGAVLSANVYGIPLIVILFC